MNDVSAPAGAAEDARLSPLAKGLRDFEAKFESAVRAPIDTASKLPPPITPPSVAPEPAPVSVDIDALIKERRQTHGDFVDDARIAQAIKYQLRQGVNWEDLSLVHREALDNIATKIARILAGDPNNLDVWTDVIGYATLALRSI